MLYSTLKYLYRVDVDPSHIIYPAFETGRVQKRDAPARGQQHLIQLSFPFLEKAHAGFRTLHPLIFCRENECASVPCSPNATGRNLQLYSQIVAIRTWKRSQLESACPVKETLKCFNRIPRCLNTSVTPFCLNTHFQKLQTL